MLVASREIIEDDRSIYENGIGDFRGRYEDGAFVSFSHAELPVEETPQILDPQVSYFDSLLGRYNVLRHQLQQVPPPDAVSRLSKLQPTYVQYLGKNVRNVMRYWSHIMSTTQPAPAQVACMDKTSVLRLIELLTKDRMMKRGMCIGLSASQWIWSLLARLPDRGELTSEEIGLLRELGKKAVLVGTGFGQEQCWEEGLLEVEEGLKGGSRSRSRSPGSISPPGDDSNEEELPLELANDDEIDLELDVEDSTDPYAEDENPEYLEPQGGETPPLDSEVSLAPNMSTALADESCEEQNLGAQAEASNETTNYDENLEAVRTRLLRQVSAQHVDFSVNLEPEIITEPTVEPAVESVAIPVFEEREPVIDLELLEWNTKATVDMILTVAGEMYGQRDLLEFRSIWTNVM